MGALRIVLISLGVAVFAAVAAVAYFPGPEKVPEETSYRIDRAERRRLASSLPGDRLPRIDHARVAMQEHPNVQRVSSHDADRRAARVVAGVLADGFA